MRRRSRRGTRPAGSCSRSGDQLVRTRRTRPRDDRIRRRRQFDAPPVSAECGGLRVAVDREPQDVEAAEVPGSVVRRRLRPTVRDLVDPVLSGEGHAGRSITPTSSVRTLASRADAAHARFRLLGIVPVMLSKALVGRRNRRWYCIPSRVRAIRCGSRRGDHDHRVGGRLTGRRAAVCSTVTAIAPPGRVSLSRAVVVVDAETPAATGCRRH